MRLTIETPDVTAGWAADLFVGAVAGAVSETAFQYSTAKGLTVILTGRGFVADAAGWPLRGIVTGIAVLDSLGNTLLEGGGVQAGLATLVRFAFGVVPGESAADGAGFLTHLLRGADTIAGSDGNDTLFGAGSGGFGADVVYGGRGEDLIRGDWGSDSLYGGDQTDTLSYDASATNPFAFRGIVLDVVAGRVQDCWGQTDSIGGFERYQDSVFDDRLTGSSAASEVWMLTAGRDVLAAGGGTDWLDYAAAAGLGGRGGILADLALGRVTDPWGERDRVSGVEGLGGTAQGDVLLGDGFANSFDGRQGADRFDGRGGFDRIGFWEVARLGGHGVVIDLALSEGQITDDGFGNTETVAAIEAFTLSSLDDRFAGTAAGDNVEGGAGDDTLSGRDGVDFLYGNAGDDQLLGGDESGYLDGGAGNDLLTGGSRDDDFVFWDRGEADADQIFGFNPAMDQILLSAGWGGVSEGTLSTVQFRAGAGVTEANTPLQRVIYDSNTGSIYFDRDGTGSAEAELVAVLDNKPGLSIAAFWIMA